MTVLLDLVDEIFYQMPLFAQIGIIFPRLLAIGPGWDHWPSPLFLNLLQKISCIIGLVTNPMLTGEPGHQGFGWYCHSLSACHAEEQRILQRIHTHMDLGTKAPSTAAQGLRGLSTVFLTHLPHKDGHG